jgi:hypothetical protein
MTISYGIYSGWYCDHAPRPYQTFGDDFVRSLDCFHLWKHCVDAYTNAAKIFITDSASPVGIPSSWLDERFEYVRLVANFGHSSVADTLFSGWARAMFLGLTYCFANGFDYAVSVEQGTLLKGAGIIERLIAQHPKADLIIPSGTGTPQPVQTGVFIVRSSAVPEFIAQYCCIRAKDRGFSPERKLADVARRMQTSVVNLGFGRARPIDFDEDHFFVRHLTSEELALFREAVGYRDRTNSTDHARISPRWRSWLPQIISPADNVRTPTESNPPCRDAFQAAVGHIQRRVDVDDRDGVGPNR